MYVYLSLCCKFKRQLLNIDLSANYLPECRLCIDHSYYLYSKQM